MESSTQIRVIGYEHDGDHRMEVVAVSDHHNKHHIEGQKYVQHFSHDQHPLVFLQKLDGSSVECQVCFKEVCDQSYACTDCTVYFHKFCFDDLHQEIQSHFHPQHPLTYQKFDNQFSSKHHCEVCYDDIQLYGYYRCDECNFNVHLDCASLTPSIKHEEHDHLLTLVKSNPSLENCRACDFYFSSGYCARCVKCRLNYHVDCVTESLPPTVKYRHHDHLLFLNENEGRRNMDNYVILQCYICNTKRNPYRPFYECHECHYSTHVHCVVTKIQTVKKQTNPYHDHSMALYPTLNSNISANCYICENRIEVEGPVIACNRCEIYRHKLCNDNGGARFKHPFHKHSCLSLENWNYAWGNGCKACGFDFESSIVCGCKEYCGFYLHIECASRRPNIKWQGHEHNLVLLRYKFEERKCEACSFDILGDYCVRCVICDFNYHVQCGVDSLPSTIEYKPHDHVLTLNEASLASFDSDIKNYCEVCGEKRNPEEPFYHCDQCEYLAHVHCAVTEVQIDDGEKLKHFSHEHYLTLYENKDGNVNTLLFCQACEMDFDNTIPAYHCPGTCNFQVHKSCVTLHTETLQHPFHPEHPLTPPKSFFGQDRICNACNKNFIGFAYECEKCNCSFHLKCISFTPSIILPEHEHKLTFFRELGRSLECVVCKSYIKANSFRCVQCNYNIHVKCSSLPETIQHASHRDHPLYLGDCCIEDQDESNADDYCDYCEVKKEHEECAYCCEECNFTVYLNCVIDEVLDSLREEHGDVMPRVVKHTKKGLTLTDMQESLTEDEKMHMERLDDDFKQKLEEIKLHGNSIPNKPFDSDETFTVYMVTSFEFEPRDLIYFYDGEELMVKVNDYMIPRSLAPVLTNILSIYGDIVAESRLSERLKTVMLSSFCGVVHSMCNTKVVDLNNILLYNWWSYLKVIQSADFEVQFVLDHLRKIAHDFFRFDAVDIQKNKVLDDLYESNIMRSRKIEELMSEIDDLRKKMKRTDEEIRENINSTLSESARKEKKTFSEIMGRKLQLVGRGLLEVTEHK